MTEHRFRLPDAEPPQPGWGVASVLIHVVLAALFVGTVGTTVIVIQEDDPIYVRIGTREHALPGRAPPAAPAQERSETGEAVPATPDSGTAIGGVTFLAPRVVPVGIPPKRIVSIDPVLGREGRIGTGYGTGRLWVGPLEGRLGLVTPSEDRSVHAARVDSAVRAKLLAFIDTIPADSFATPDVKPWVTEINGQKWGVDGSWVYLGGLKLPTMLLALLPLPQGNYEAARQAAELQRIREQIIRAAWQAETNADFRRYVKAIRERKDREREEARRWMRRDSIP